MDSDIDIEEHDVLDNPALRNVFPDLSVLKREILGYDEDYVFAGQELDRVTKIEKPGSSTSEHLPTDVSCVRKGAPCVTSIQNAHSSNEENVTITKTDNIMLQSPKIGKSYLCSNKIILGSKPSKISIQKENKLNNCQDARVVLKDIASFLNKSYRYCKQCFILFPEKHIYDIHVRNWHGSLNRIVKRYRNAHNPVDSQLKNDVIHKCNICDKIFSNLSNLNKHNKNTHKIDNMQKRDDTNNSCFHCGKVFPTQKRLIEHIYEVLQSKEPNTNNKTNEKTIENMEKTQEKKNDGNAIHQNKSNKHVGFKSKLYNCPICSYYFKSKKYYSSHMTIKHKITTYHEPDPVSFKPLCTVCLITYKDVDSYNKHIHNRHRDLIYQVKKNKPRCITKTSLQDNNATRNITTDNKIRTHLNSPSLLEGTSVETPQSTHAVQNNSEITTGKVFPTQKTLMEHRYKVLQSKKPNTNNKTNEQTIENMEKTQEKRNDGNANHQNKTNKHVGFKSKLYKDKLYNCPICSYYFKAKKFYSAHMIIKHKITTYHEPDQVSFKPLCTVCLITYKDVDSYNKHIHNRHRDLIYQVKKNKPRCITKTSLQDNKATRNITTDNKIRTHLNSPSLLEGTSVETPQSTHAVQNNSEITTGSLVLKSVLFKCLKCDINFLSTKAAMLHSSHINVLTNWKCTICQHTFKKVDESLHLKQHSFSQIFDIYNLSESALSNVLYNCLKCSIHFSEDVFLRHYLSCGTKIPNSVYCKICNILVGSEIWRCHDYSHKHRNLECSDFTLIDGHVILNDINKEFTENNKTTKNNKRKSNYSVKNTRKVTVPEKLKVLLNRNKLAYIYCETCKCCVTSKCKQIHLESGCEKLLKYVCKYCGILFTNKSINTHRKLHKNKTLTLHDFKFYNFNSKRICPPITEFPSCTVCKVQFVYKADVQRHECEKEEYLTCHSCFTKLSDTAFKLHMSFHSYSIADINKSNSKQIQYDLNLKDTENALTDLELKEPKQYKDLLYFQQEKFNLLYTCKNCNLTVNTYDKVIEHCHDHYDRSKMQISTETCNLCNLNFIKDYYIEHKILHTNEKIAQFKKKVLEFDPFYFISNDTVWIRHLFETLPEREVQEILNRSIYKIENKIKMEIIQDGPPDLTVYKCAKCRCFIDISKIHKHIDICSNVKKHPCSFCGLPFNSSFSRITHEQIHKRPDLSLKSFRIVIFNKNKDKEFNKDMRKRTKYVLYQCRNCNGIVEKVNFVIHKCNTTHLKKCVYCGLLLYNSDYESHVDKHKSIDNFNVDNIKVILFGDEPSNKNTNEVYLSPSFYGMLHDYVLFKCKKCELCLKNKDSAQKHNCSNIKYKKNKCPFCHLYLFQTGFKSHCDIHELDPDFVRENIRIVQFDNFDENIEKTNDKNSILEIELPTSEGELVSKNVQDDFKDYTITPLSNVSTHMNDSQKFAIENVKSKDTSALPITEPSMDNDEINNQLLLESNNITEDKIIDFGNQPENSSSISKRIEFTTNKIKEFDSENVNSATKELSNSQQITEIVNLDKNIEISNEIADIKLYKCACCNLHFLDESSTISHLDQHISKAKICKQTCPKCDLVFTPNTLFNHLITHHGAKNVNLKFIVEEVHPK